ncbi:MAG: DUF308 domain-containing protein [Spirochaetales bacterium]|nr:DUF308 domain-containing protein [Spirochaetales bacterium]
MKKSIFFLLLGLLIIALGVFIWVRPNTFVNVLAIAFSLFIFFMGAKSLMAYFKLKNKGSKALLNTLLIKSLVNMLVATSALIIIFTKKEAVLNLLVYIIAADLIASAFVDLLDSFIIRKAGLDYSYSPLRFQALLGFAFGILFIVFPQFIGKTGLTIIAVIFIVIGLFVSFYAYHVYVLGKMMKKATAAPQIQEASAEFEEKNE